MSFIKDNIEQGRPKVGNTPKDADKSEGSQTPSINWHCKNCLFALVVDVGEVLFHPLIRTSFRIFTETFQMHREKS